jgi:predicted nucleotidyltransferase/DNA-binding XRE family transcriptional regulator
VDASTGTAAALLREARRRAGLTQVELAQRAGVAQSVISAYESGRRQPALPTLTALVAAAGLDLAVTLRRRPDRTRGMTGPVGRIVRQRRRELVTAAQAHGASNLRVFGSVARGGDRPDSDVDVLVDLPASVGLFGLGRLQSDLESVLDGIRVDLVPAGDLKPDVRGRVEAEAVPL